MGEGCVPGGHELEVPPQQEHRNPSMAQYFQYSQLCGSSTTFPAVGAVPEPCLAGAAGVCARADRSTGSSGSSAAPVNIRPTEANRLRREVRFAMERAEFSK